MNGFYLEHKFNHEQFSTLNKNKSMNGFLEWTVFYLEQK
jgi:hypothetical protein